MSAAVPAGASKNPRSGAGPLQVWAWNGIVTAAYFAAAMVRLHTGRATTWDFGYFAQELWLIAHGHWVARSTLNGHSALTEAGSAPVYPIGWLYANAAWRWNWDSKGRVRSMGIPGCWVGPAPYSWTIQSQPRAVNRFRPNGLIYHRLGKR